MWHWAGSCARNRAVSTAIWLVLLLGALLLGLRLWPHAALRDGISTSIPVLARDGTLLRLTLAGDQQYRLWTPLDRITPVLVDSALLYEDRGFWYHPGVNPLALLRSVFSMAQGGRRAGGSTVTMQLARRLYRIDSRTFSGKLQQIAAAFWLEARYSKHAILEAYLNTVPYGGNIEGVGAASLIYFRHDAAKLTLPEALTLAVIPQNPTQRLATRLGSAQDAFGHAQNAALEAARGRLWALWQARYPVAANAQASEALLHLPALSRASLPFVAPHVTDMLIAQSAQEGVRSADGAIHSTIDVAMQRTVERVMASYLQARANIGLRNASAVLLDASTMQVRALVGSANYADAKIDGQFNGTQGKRSPGSTLKPFIYALALDQGLLHPRTILRDAPTSFGAFTPENFDGQFEGPVAAQDALTRSRNIPAVSVASRLTQPNLYQYLQMNQISRLESEDHYGLALVLGGGEVTPEELARMYAVLANAGQSRVLAYTQAQSRVSPATAAQVLLSPAAAFITLDMLRQTPRPDTGAPAQPPIAWKTGTSWAFRDAWTAGVFGRHVLVVWVGDFEGASNPAYVGIEAAAPLFLRIVDALRAQGLDPGEVAQSQPADLRRVEVCTATGGLPDGLCPARSQTWFIAGKSPIAASTLHQTVWVDTKTGQQVCAADAANGAHNASARQVVVEQWGSEMQGLFRQAGLPRRSVRCPDQAGGSSHEGPAISSPLRGLRYMLDPRHPQAVLLRAEAAPGIKKLYWFVGDSLLGSGAPGESFAWTPPRPGDYKVRVVDESGRADVRHLRVELQ